MSSFLEKWKIQITYHSCAVLVFDIFIVSDPIMPCSWPVGYYQVYRKKGNIPRLNVTLCISMIFWEIAIMNKHISPTECLVSCQIHTFCFPKFFWVVTVKMSHKVRRSGVVPSGRSGVILSYILYMKFEKLSNFDNITPIWQYHQILTISPQFNKITYFMTGPLEYFLLLKWCHWVNNGPMFNVQGQKLYCGNFTNIIVNVS